MMDGLPNDVREKAAKAACVLYWDENQLSGESMYHGESHVWDDVVDAVAKVLAEHAHAERDEMATAAKAVKEERDQLRLKVAELANELETAYSGIRYAIRRRDVERESETLEQYARQIRAALDAPKGGGQ